MCQADLAKDMLAGNVDPTITADAWSHAAEVGSRTLGIDPFRLNTDLLSRSASSPAFGVFVKQPARIARLVMHNIANNNLGGLYTMLAATALLGGRAALPLEVRRMWSMIDPDSAYQTEKALDQANMYRDITGQDSADKLDWSLAYPIQAATNPAVELAHQIPSAATDLYHATHALKDAESSEDVVADEKLFSAAQRLFSTVSTIAKPKIAGVPVKQALAVMKSGQEIVNHRSSISYFNPTVGHAIKKRDELDDEDYNIGPVDVIKDFLLPGRRSYESALLQAANEETDKKRLGRDTSYGAYDRERILQNMRSGRPVLE